jgi:hypothetical protein
MEKSLKSRLKEGSLTSTVKSKDPPIEQATFKLRIEGG